MTNKQPHITLQTKMPEFYQCVCSLWVLERGAPDLIGSGTLLKIEQAVFLITAAHVIDSACNQPLLVRGPMGLKKIAGCGKLTRSASGLRKDDRDDISVIALDEDTTAFIETTYKPLPLAYADADDSFVSEKAYAFFGFPWRKGGFHEKGRILEPPIHIFQAVSVPEAVYGYLGLSTQKHMAVEFDLKHAIDANGRDVVAPNPEGMSGGPVWSFVVTELNGQQMLTRRLVGIAVKYVSTRRVLVGVRINAAFECIRMMAPSLSELIPAKPDLAIICKHSFHN